MLLRKIAILLRLLAVFGVVALQRPAPVEVPPGPSQTVSTTIPILGAHTRLIDEVEPWKIKRSLQMVREMGAPWIVEFFPWAYIEPAPGRFDWRQSDLIVEHATAQGLTIIARLGLTPQWARPADTPLEYLTADAYAAYAAYAAALADRYRGRVETIIIGNEPNLAFEWGFRPTTAADYVELLRAVYPAVKAVNPNVIVLGGALAPTREPPGSPNGLSDLLYLDAMYAAGAADYFDGLAVHAYGAFYPPTAPPDPDVLNLRRVELLRAIMVENSDAATPIYITEFGYNDHPRWTQAVTSAERTEYTLEALRWMEREWPWVEMAAIWVFRTPAPVGGYRDYYALVTPEFIARPLYAALAEATGNE